MRTAWLPLLFVLGICVTGCTGAGSEPGSEVPVLRALSELPAAEARTIALKLDLGAHRLAACVRGATFYSADGGLLGMHGSATGLPVHLDTAAGLDTLIFSDAPGGFGRIDLHFDRVIIGGGDVAGLGDGELDGHCIAASRIDGIGGGDVAGIVIGGGDVAGLGGGDVAGIVLPHLVIDREGGEWRSVTARADGLEVPDGTSSLGREQLVADLATRLRVMEGSALVGRGNREETGRRSGLDAYDLQSGATVCHDDIGPLERCSGTPGEPQCASTPYCGQDAQYRPANQRYFDMYQEQVEHDWVRFYVVDMQTGLAWDQDAWRCETVDGCTAAELETFCAGRGMRLPTLFDLLGIVDFGRDSGLVDPFTEHRLDIPLLTTTSFGGEPIVLDDRRLGASGPATPGSRFVGRCVKQVTGYVSSWGAVAPGPGDITNGLLWKQLDARTDWAGALSACEGLALYGFTDWRLPNMVELITFLLAADQRGNGDWWSSTPLLRAEVYAWSLQAAVPAWDWTPKKDEPHGVMCVRSVP